MSKIVQLPPVTSPQFNQSLKQWVETRDGVSGSSGLKLDRFVRVTDLLDPDFINSLAGYKFPITGVNPEHPYTGDTDAPRPPTNLQITSEAFRNILTWDDPNSDNFWYIEVWRAKVPAGDAAPTVGNAIKVASVPKTVESFIDTEVSVTAYDHYYWIRAVSYSGIASVWQDGYIEGHCTVSATIDNIMDILKGADPDAWSSVINYVAADRVLHGGKKYSCILANTNQEPPNATYWERSGILLIGEVGGVSTVGIDGNLIVDGSIYADAINTDNAFIGMTIQSSVFTEGSVGWRINKDGNVEFNSGVFRGTTIWAGISGVPAIPSDEHLVGYWAFDDGIGRIATDGSGNENHGELIGFPTLDTYELNEFQNSSDGFTATNADITENADSITLEAIASNPQLRKAGMSIVGGDHYIVSVRIKRIAGSTWRGKLYYSTGGHGNSESYKKHFSQPSNFSVYQTIVLDMRDLTAGGDDWIDNTITALRFDFGNVAGDNFEIDWIKIGQNIWVDGHVGKCVNIAGVEYAQAAIQVAAPLTLTFWFKPSSDTTQVSGGLFLLWQDATHEIAFKLYNSGTPNPYIDSTGYVTQHTHGEYTFLANQWYMGVFKLATGSMQLDIWKDGEIVNTRSHSDAGYASYNFTYLFWGSFGSDCCYDEVRLYDSILTDSEIKALNLYPAGNKSSIPGNMDQIPGGDLYGKLLKTSISAGKILLTAEGVDGSLSSTLIKPGSITLTKCAEDISENLFSSKTSKSNIEAWRQAGSPTHIDGTYIFAQSITADKFISTLYGDLNQAMNYVKTVLAAGDEYEHAIVAADLAAAISKVDIDGADHFDYGPSIRLNMTRLWDDGAAWWDTANCYWDKPTELSGIYTSAVEDLGSSKTIQLSLEHQLFEDSDVDTSYIVEGTYSHDGISGGTNAPALDDGNYETFTTKNISGNTYLSTGTLFTFRYFIIKITLTTSDTSKRIVIYNMFYKGNIINVFGMEVNKTIAAGGTAISLSGFNSAPAITFTPIGATTLVPKITAQSANSVTVHLMSLADVSVGGNANMTIIGV